MEYVRVCMCVCLCLTFHVKNLGLWNAKCTQKPFSHVDIEVHGLAIFDHAKQRAFSLTLMRSCLRKQRPKLTLAVVCSKFHQKWLKIAATKRTWMAESAMPDHCQWQSLSELVGTAMSNDCYPMLSHVIPCYPILLQDFLNSKSATCLGPLGNFPWLFGVSQVKTCSMHLGVFVQPWNGL